MVSIVFFKVNVRVAFLDILLSFELLLFLFFLCLSPQSSIRSGSHNQSKSVERAHEPIEFQIEFVQRIMSYNNQGGILISTGCLKPQLLSPLWRHTLKFRHLRGHFFVWGLKQNMTMGFDQQHIPMHYALFRFCLHFQSSKKPRLKFRAYF